MKKFPRKTFLFTTVLILCVVCFYYDNLFSVKFMSKQNNQDEFLKFENILNARVQPRHGQNVFFVESSDSVTLNARQCCAIESAALANADLEIFVVFTSKERLDRLNETEELQTLFAYPNVHLHYLDIVEFSKASPLGDFIKRGQLNKSNHKTTHTSDVVRLLLLWMYGGTYLDLDVIVRRGLSSLPSNFACPVTDSYLNTAILNLDTQDGKRIAETLMEYTSQYFNRNDALSGQFLLTEVARQLCNTTSTSQMNFVDDCRGFHVLPRRMCYAVNNFHWEWLVQEEFAEDTLMRVVGSFIVHFWNGKTQNIKLKKDSKVAYVQLAKQHCPRVMQTSGEYF